MFSNAYNRKIADEVHKLNQKFITHQKRVGRAMTGGAQYMVGSGMTGGNWIDDMTSGISQGMNAILSPISTVAQHVAPFLPLLAAGKPKGKAGRPKKVGGAETGGKRKAGRPRKMKGGADSSSEEEGDPLLPEFMLNHQINSFNTMPIQQLMEYYKDRAWYNALPEVLKVIVRRRLAPFHIGGKKKKAGRPRKMKGGMVEEPVLNEKEGGKKKKAGRPRKVKGGMEGEGIFSSLLSKIGLGEGEDMEGGKKKKAKKGKGSTGGAETGGKRKKTSPWIAHVKAYAKKHNMKYNEALKDPKCKASYK